MKDVAELMKDRLEDEKLPEGMRQDLKRFDLEQENNKSIKVKTRFNYINHLYWFGRYLVDKQYTSYKQATKDDIVQYLNNPYPRPELVKNEEKLAFIQRKFSKKISKKKKGSKNRKRAKHKVSLIHEKITNTRADFLHK
ncbi:hypothetical protein H0N98_04780, partial [Candidatus Micrarchaeota archaeon]|nr:hypothetical protein [Candidatus Micrarchaeota archaeon]